MAGVAARHLDNLDHTTRASHLRDALSKADAGVLGLLYLGSFGSWIGGRLADRLGGSRVTMAVFVAMSVVTGALVAISLAAERHGHSSALMGAYIVTFIGPE